MQHERFSLASYLASVGVMDLVNCLAYVSNQLTSAPPAAVDEDLEQYRALLRGKIDVAPRGTVEGLTYAQDGVMYKDGYRIEKFDDERLDQLNVKIRELEKKSHEKDQKLDQLNVKLQELERKSAEREMVIDELRSRSASRAVSPMPSTSRSSGVFRDIPKILLDEGESQPGSKKFRPIHREDELRRTIKKRSVSSNVSEDRTEELEALSQLEDDEASQMDDYVPLVYAREDEPNSSGMKHKISPIQELCAMHETEERQRTMERSPEPAMAAGDISESKEKSLIHSSKVILIEEDIRDSDSSALEDNDALLSQRASPRNTLPELPQLTKEMFLTTSESVPSNLSSHSNSPDPDQPYLKRTRKKSDLTALLLDEERKTSAFSGVIIQTVEYESEEDVDRTEFMQSKSPSPYVGAFLDNERLESTGQLIPLVSDLPKSTSSEERSSSQELLQKSTESAIGQSRNASSSPAPIGSSGSPASPVSSIVDDSIKDGPSHAGDDRLTSSPTPSDRNVSRDGSVSLASTGASAGSLDLHVDLAPQQEQSPLPLLSSPSPPLAEIQQKITVADLEAGGDDRKSSKSPVTVTAKRRTPPRRIRARKRLIRSVTPIDFNQTFMEQFTEQRISVSPSELEDYINSMDEIKIDPPKPVTPNYFLPTTPMTSGVPSLIVTDERGADARFHDSLSTKSFYGKDNTTPIRTLDHRVSYIEWIEKFPDNMTSHLELEDYDSDDEEVENIINGASVTLESDNTRMALNVEPDQLSVNSSSDVSSSPAISEDKEPEISLNLSATSSPDISLSTESKPDSSSLALGSPLLNSIPSPNNHFTPISSPVPSSILHSSSPRSLPRLVIPSRSPTASPIPRDMTPEEMVYDIGHLNGLIFETKSRSPTPQLQQTTLSPEELAYDIGNLGGLILGTPSRSASPLPPSPSPTPGSLPLLSPSSTPIQQTSITGASADSSSRPHLT
ncbi:cell surface glycoprotein 1 isoform X2 [Wyeomyia smithii]|uniref:cell surface glycoprotein 1 isoform X2 n=1 Tax=Wyeomyia smithii TaxID=174621 RepID=UPI0024680172|nr:cell surface glycoprotein 1 isoform X2 [Wyeomyia smithii]